MKPQQRLLRILAWLLTPLVAWATSFLGGWIGALLWRSDEPALTGLKALGIGSVIGGLAGAVGWVWYLWHRRPSLVTDDTEQTDGS